MPLQPDYILLLLYAIDIISAIMPLPFSPWYFRWCHFAFTINIISLRFFAALFTPFIATIHYWLRRLLTLIFFGYAIFITLTDIAPFAIISYCHYAIIDRWHYAIIIAAAGALCHYCRYFHAPIAIIFITDTPHFAISYCWCHFHGYCRWFYYDDYTYADIITTIDALDIILLLLLHYFFDYFHYIIFLHMPLLLYYFIFIH